MKEVIKHLDWVGFPGYSVSSLGYVLNRKTEKALFTKVKSGQIALTDDLGRRVYTQVRSIVGDHFNIPGEGEYVWHLDNNPFNSAVSNLVRTPKRAHKVNAVYAAYRLFRAGKTVEEIDQFTGLGKPFVIAVKEWLQEPEHSFLTTVSQKWVDDRLEILRDYGMLTPERQYVGGVELILPDNVLRLDLRVADTIERATFFTIDEASEF